MSEFIEFWNKLIFNPTKFFRDDFKEDRSPYFYFVIFIFGLSGAIDQLNSQLIELDLKGNLDMIKFLNNWMTYWVIGIIGGIIGGILFYYLGGWFYNIRVGWADGIKNIKQSRFIYLYSSFVPAFLSVVLSFIYALSNPKPYLPYEEGIFFDVISMGLVILASYYSIYISYRGVTVIMSPKKWKSRIWFVILPFIFYSVGILSLITILMRA